jgi:phosphoglycerol transferase MdoB-like AlkP superfamily enzyme
MQKAISIIFLIFDLYIGTRFLLNVLNILHTSKYSKGATLAYAIIFLSLSIIGFVLLFSKTNTKWVFWMSIGPWLLMIVLLFLNMLVGDYK